MKKLFLLIFIFCMYFDLGCQAETIKVAILGSGINPSKEHIYINKNEIPNNGIDDDNNGFIDDINGWNFLDNNNLIWSGDIPDWHEDFIADNILDNISRKYDFEFMSIKIYESKDFRTSDLRRWLTQDEVIRAAQYAIDNGANIITLAMDFDLDNPIDVEKMFIDNKDVLFVRAAGNRGEVYSSLHCNNTGNSYDNVIVVGALDGDNIAPYSNYGNCVDIYLSGRHYFLNKEGHIDFVNGTSFATPKAVAKCINIMRKLQTTNPKEVKKYLVNEQKKN